jgi:hypothetical protein
MNASTNGARWGSYTNYLGQLVSWYDDGFERTFLNAIPDPTTARVPPISSGTPIGIELISDQDTGRMVVELSVDAVSTTESTRIQLAYSHYSTKTESYGTPRLQLKINVHITKDKGGRAGRLLVQIGGEITGHT